MIKKLNEVSNLIIAAGLPKTEAENLTDQIADILLDGNTRPVEAVELAEVVKLTATPEPKPIPTKVLLSSKVIIEEFPEIAQEALKLQQETPKLRTYKLAGVVSIYLKKAIPNITIDKIRTANSPYPVATYVRSEIESFNETLLAN